VATDHHRGPSWYESSSAYYLTFPYLDGGELLQRLNMHGRFTEEATKQVVRVILVCPA
jgi:serine/threonine protein kinase